MERYTRLSQEQVLNRDASSNLAGGTNIFIYSRASGHNALSDRQGVADSTLLVLALQRWFYSRLRLQSHPRTGVVTGPSHLSSLVEHFLDVEVVTGSIPVDGTMGL